MTPEEFKYLYKSTKDSNKATMTERLQIRVWLMAVKEVYIYNGGRHLNGISTPPKLNKIRFKLKPIQK